MNQNYDVKTFTENQDLAPSNQFLINYGISILSIENIFDFFFDQLENNHLVLSNSLDG